MRAFFCPAMRGNDEEPGRQGPPRTSPGKGQRDERAGATRPAAGAGARRAAAGRRLRPGGPGPPDPRSARERLRRRRRARAAGEDRRGPDAAARGERRQRQALGQRLRQSAPRHAGRRRDRAHRRAPGREGRCPRRPRVAPLPGGAQRSRHLRGWIEHDPAHAERVVTELRAAAAASPAAALRRAIERQPGHPSAEAIARWLASREVERPDAPAKPRSRAARRRWRRALARKGGRP